MERDGTKAIPRVTDYGAGFSLANLGEIMFPCLEAVAPKGVLEVGAFKGELTRVLLDWAGEREVRVAAIDPEPRDELLELGRQHPELELILETSHEALRHVSLPDAVIIDGDHNYYTLSEELRLIDERAADGELPLLLFHDVGWPHARRDSYCAPERIPEEHRQPLAHDVTLAPWEPGVAPGGLPFEWAAEREGGPRNGVLTALEDFVDERQDLRLAVIPPFFGFGVLWQTSAPWSDAVASIVEPWDRNPLLERLELHRVTHLAVRLTQARELEETRERNAQHVEVLHAQARRLLEHERLFRAMLGSRAFAVAERLSRLNQRGRPIFTRDQVRRALDDAQEPDPVPPDQGTGAAA